MKYYSADHIMENWMGRACSTYGTKKILYRIFMEKETTWMTQE